MVAEIDDRQDKYLCYETSIERLMCEILTSFFCICSVCGINMNDTSECNKEGRLGT